MDCSNCFRTLGLGAVVLLMGASAAMPAVAQSSIVDEVKVGVLAHDVGFAGHHVESGADIIGEVLFKSPDLFRYIGSPRPTLGASVNTDGNTDYAYFDFTWTATLFRPQMLAQDGVYAGLFLGGAVHDGHLDTAPSDRKALGTRALYHLGVFAGYQLTPVVSLEIYYDHLSNANASSHNPGLNNIGARTGFKF